MKRRLFAVMMVSSLGLLAAGSSSARDTKNMWPIADAMGTTDAKAKLDKGDSTHPEVALNFGVYMSNKKTNGANKKDKEACEWAFLSAMISFQERAVAPGRRRGRKHQELLPEERDLEPDAV